MRKICYISGTRADFGLMKNALQAIDLDKDLDLEVVLTGMHLLKEYGNTYQEINESGLKISGRVEVELSGDSGSQMSKALGAQIIGFTKILESNKPDIVLLLGDRGEMLAGAITALHLNIPIVHIHGGELSGTIDEHIRHAISKLAHYHFTATNCSKERLIKMGELAENIYVTGAPGLDEIRSSKLINRNDLLEKYCIDSMEPFALLLLHPVVQQLENTKIQVIEIVESMLSSNKQILALMPNADAGGRIISSVLKKYEMQGKIKTAVHIERLEFLSLLSEAEFLAGNSSSGIIEAASLGTRVLNIGNRQNFRERSDNIIDVTNDKPAILDGLIRVKRMNSKAFNNIYGDGRSSNRITSLLKSVSINPIILEKVNAY